MRKTELGGAFGVMHSVSASANASPRATCVVHLEGYGEDARAGGMLGHPVSIVNLYQLRKLIEERDTLRAALEKVHASGRHAGCIGPAYAKQVSGAYDAVAAALADEDSVPGSTVGECYP